VTLGSLISILILKSRSQPLGDFVTDDIQLYFLIDPSFCMTNARYFRNKEEYQTITIRDKRDLQRYIEIPYYPNRQVINQMSPGLTPMLEHSMLEHSMQLGDLQ
jgi:hypothetical protein